MLLLIWGADSLLDQLADDGGSGERNVTIHVTEAEAYSTQEESIGSYEPGPEIPDVTPPENPAGPPEIPPVVDPVLDGGDGEGGPVGM